MSRWHDLSGEQKKQLLITTDKKGNPLGEDTRENCHTGDGKTHLAFLAFIFNNNGEIYLQQRSRSKSLWDGYWDASVVSHVLPGETVEEAARRRGKEEMGIDVQFRNLGGYYYFSKYNGNCENEYCHVLIGKTNMPISYNPVEIAEVKKITRKDLLNDISTNNIQITPWLKIAMERFNRRINP